MAKTKKDEMSDVSEATPAGGMPAVEPVVEAAPPAKPAYAKGAVYSMCVQKISPGHFACWFEKDGKMTTEWEIDQSAAVIRSRMLSTADKLYVLCADDK